MPQSNTLAVLDERCELCRLGRLAQLWAIARKVREDGVAFYWEISEPSG
jgi:hypothetical protein